MADHPMTLADYSTRKRHDILWEALDTVLRTLEQAEASTNDIAGMLMTQLELSTKEAGVVLTWLRRVAPLVPEASHTGAVVKVFDRYGRRWIWSPRASGLKPAAVVDASDW